MPPLQPPKELHLKSGSAIRNYFRQFSATEKAVFGALVITAVVTAAIMAEQINIRFMQNVPGYGGELREGIVGLPRTVNPVLAVTDVDRDISGLVYAGLMKYDGDSIVPDIARSYQVSADGLTYTFSLRNDVQFQDGKPLTAEDVAFTIQKIQDPALKSPRHSDWANVAVKVVSPYSIEFSLRQPYSPFLSNATVGILPKHIWGGVSDDQFIFSEYNLKPVGAGPYRVKGVSRDSGGIPVQYALSTWNDYFAAVPHLDAVSFVFFSDEDKALAALDSGSIDSLASISPSDGARLATDSAEPYTVLSTPLPRIFGVFFNQSQSAALSDYPARVALDMAVDRNAIVKAALAGYGIPIHGPLPPGLVTAATSTAAATASTSPDRADLAGAQMILERNGWKMNASHIYEKKTKTATITLQFDIYTADTPDLRQAADMVKNDWTKLGADVSVKVFEPSELYQSIIRTRKYDALLFGEFIGKDKDLYAFWHSSQRNAPGLNVSLYANSKADKLLEDIRTTGDESARTAKYAQFAATVASDMPAVFLFSPDFIYAVPKALRGIDLGTVTVPSDRWNSIGEWFMATEQVWGIFNKK